MKYTKILRELIGAQDRLIETQKRIINNLEGQIRAKDRLESLLNGNLVYYKGKYFYPQTVEYVEDTMEKLQTERIYCNMLDTPSFVKGSAVYLSVKRNMENTPGIVW